MQTPHKASTKALALFIFLHYLSIQVSSADILKQGESLNSTSQLVSANGIFTLKFHTPQDTNNTYLAIWFKDLRTVWIGNREKPIPSNSSPALTVGIIGELSITHDRGEAVQIYAGGSGQNVTARLLKTGNLVLTSDQSSGILWQSLDHPTDTLLPGMKLGKSGTGLTLSSWLTTNNPSSGLFTLEWDPSSRNFLVRRKGAVYWRSGELKYYSDEDGSMRVDLENFTFRRDRFNFYYNFTSIRSDDEDYLIFSLLPIPLSETAAISGWSLDDEGDIYDIDRSMTIARPSLCYNYYNDKSAVIKGCEPREQPKCRNERHRFVFKSGDFRPDRGQLEVVYDTTNSNLSLSDCQEVCWNDCDCVAYRGGDGDGCSYWKGNNLVFEQSIAGTSIQKYFLEIAPSSKGMKKYVRIMLIVLASVVLLIFGIALFLVRKHKRGKREEELRELLTLEGYTETPELENGGAKSHDLKLFTYASIMSATRNFSPGRKLGEGGFGPVYKGKTAEGQDIAVKLLSRLSGQGLIEFKTELILISKLQHVNLVKLLGFCIHGDDKMIIYEYMQNKSLDVFLFSPSKKEQLDWQKRFNIIEGTAQGLLYLHKYSRLRIIHRDLKPNNILLDENMNPKISDFGLARIFKQNADEANTNRRVGTYGYMAPEYAMQGIFSVKSDVYSFGVLVLEIVSGRKNNCFHQIEGPLNLVEYVWELWRKDSAIELMDPTLKDTCIDQLQRCIHIGLLCVENHAVDRPAIEDVISMLKNETTSLPMPKSPAFITRNSVLEEVAKSIPEKLSSSNEVTLSEMEGR